MPSVEEEDVKPNPAWKIALVGIPLFLILSTAGSIWVWVKRGQDDVPDPRLALAAGEVSEVELLDHMKKLTELIGTREWQSEAGRKNLKRTVAFIDGTLGPQNYGFRVGRDRQETFEGELWPILVADLEGSSEPDGIVFAVIPYDGEAASVALALAAANDLRDEKQNRTIRFVFYPAELMDGAIPVADLLGAGEEARERLEVGVDPELPLPAFPDGGELKRAARAVAGELRRLANQG
jgi:hypothetical protein